MGRVARGEVRSTGEALAAHRTLHDRERLLLPAGRPKRVPLRRSPAPYRMCLENRCPSSPATTGTARFPDPAVLYCSPLFLTLNSSDKSVAGAMHGKKIAWLFGVGLQLLAQAHQMSIHGSGCGIAVIAPHFLEEPVAAENFTRMTDEILKQFEFG